MARSDLVYAQWAAVGKQLGAIGRCSQWWIGDWIRFGNRRYGEKYVLAAKLTGYDVHSLRNMAYVAAAYDDMSRRRENLSWSHHTELAALDHDQREFWLDRAVQDRLSVADLRTELRNAAQRTRVLEPPVERSADASVLRCPHCGHEIDLVSANVA